MVLCGLRVVAGFAGHVLVGDGGPHWGVRSRGSGGCQANQMFLLKSSGWSAGGLLGDVGEGRGVVWCWSV